MELNHRLLLTITLAVFLLNHLLSVSARYVQEQRTMMPRRRHISYSRPRFAPYPAKRIGAKTYRDDLQFELKNKIALNNPHLNSHLKAHEYMQNKGLTHTDNDSTYMYPKFDHYVKSRSAWHWNRPDGLGHYNNHQHLHYGHNYDLEPCDDDFPQHPLSSLSGLHPQTLIQSLLLHKLFNKKDENDQVDATQTKDSDVKSLVLDILKNHIKDSWSLSGIDPPRASILSDEYRKLLHYSQLLKYNPHHLIPNYLVNSLLDAHVDPHILNALLHHDHDGHLHQFSWPVLTGSDYRRQNGNNNVVDTDNSVISNHHTQKYNPKKQLSEVEDNTKKIKSAIEPWEIDD